MVSCASLMGVRSSERNWPVERCVSGSKARIDSSVSPKKSSRSGAASAGAIEIEDAAALRVIADVPHQTGARETVRFEPADQRLHVERIAGGDRERGLGEPGARRDALRHGVDGGHKNARPLGRAARQREAGERGHALRGDGGVGRDAVVGLAVPGRQHKRLDLGRGEGERVDEALRAHGIAREEGQRDGAPLGVAGERAHEIGDDEGVEAFRRAGERNGGRLAEPRGGGDGGVHAVGAAFSFANSGVSKRAGEGGLAGEPGEDFGSGSVEPGLDLVELGLGEVSQMRVGEAAERDVHLAQAAAAGAKQNAAPSRVEPGAGEGHGTSLRARAPSRRI